MDEPLQRLIDRGRAELLRSADMALQIAETLDKVAATYREREAVAYASATKERCEREADFAERQAQRERQSAGELRARAEEMANPR